MPLGRSIFLLLFIFSPFISVADSQLCARAVKETGDRSLVGDYRAFRDGCSAYQQCTDKVLKADNLYLRCRSKCGSVSGSQKKSCLKDCLSKTPSKTNETSRRVQESCSSLKTGNKCEKLQQTFQKVLNSKGQKGEMVEASCALMFDSL